jgi:para-nitrobenzyl esterase
MPFTARDRPRTGRGDDADPGETILRNHTPWLRRATVAGLSCILLAACGDDDDDKPSLQRATQYGPVTGAEDTASGTLSWKGIPYARPPVGELRWRAPVAPEPWTAARAATAFGNACVQYGRIYGPGANNRYDESIGTTLNQAVGSEDCLYLNVWRPSTNDGNLPVIVFFHGGSNVSGYTADPMYEGANLARTANAVVVTPNFRLGIFGFLNLPQLKTGTDPLGDSGNFALLDSIEALRWVSRNAERFGGDPANVTIMGQSAGAINVLALHTSPAMVAATPKLFRRTVPMSGGISLATNLPAGSIPTLSPASTYLAQGRALLSGQLIADGLATDAPSADAWVAARTPAQVAEYLRGRPPSALLQTLLARLAAGGLAGSGPIPDGQVVATDPIAAIAAGNYVPGPMLASNTRDEGTLFPSFLPLVGGTGNARIVTDAQLFANHFSYDPNAPARTSIEQWIAPGYLPASAPVTGFTARAQTLNEVFFLRSRDNLLNTLKARQNEVWYYRFDWDEQPAPWNAIYGASHAFDLPFVFGNFRPSLFSNVSFTEANRPGRQQLSDAMMRSIGAFARRGDPNDPSLGVTWPTWPSRLVFDATPAARTISVQ